MAILPFSLLVFARDRVHLEALYAFGQLRYFEADQCERQRDFADAMRAFAASAIARPDFDKTWVRIASIAAKAAMSPLADRGLDKPQCAGLTFTTRLAHLAALGETDGSLA